MIYKPFWPWMVNSCQYVMLIHIYNYIRLQCSLQRHDIMKISIALKLHFEEKEIHSDL